jgi:hypothetical protein
MIDESTSLVKKLRVQEISKPTPELVRNKSEVSTTYPNGLRYMSCDMEDCQFNPFSRLKCTYLTRQLVEVMDEQYNIRSKVEWPENPLILRNIEEESSTLVISSFNVLGTIPVGPSLLCGEEERVRVISRCNDVNRRKGVNMQLIDPSTRRMSCIQGLRVDFDHFLMHQSAYIERGKADIEKERRTIQRIEMESQRRDRQLR